MDIIICKLIEDITKCLERENEDRNNKGERLVDIPFNIIALEQHLGNDKYSELHNVLLKHNYDISFKGDAESFCTEGDIIIHYDSEDNLDTEYVISLMYDNRFWGMCECNENDKDYDNRYSCCGHGCDWTAPAFSVTKQMLLGYDDFNGDAHDLWTYQDRYNNVTVKDKEESERLAKIKTLKEQKKYIEKQLSELEN